MMLSKARIRAPVREVAIIVTIWVKNLTVMSEILLDIKFVQINQPRMPSRKT